MGTRNGCNLPAGTTPTTLGDKVTHKGGCYESTIDANVWAPDVYPAGWKTIPCPDTTQTTKPKRKPKP